MTEVRLEGYGQEGTAVEGARGQVVRTCDGLQMMLEIGNMEDTYEQVLMHLDDYQLLQLMQFIEERREELRVARLEE